jgi:hypothetical protein
MSFETRKIKAKTDIVLREEDEGAFLFDPNTGRICYLNTLGTKIWKSCNQVTNLERIVDKISLDFTDISRERIIEDCMKFLQDLGNFGFLAGETKEKGSL